MRGNDHRLTRLARAGAAGDADALSELVQATQGDVWRFIAHLAGRDVADDLTQETYLRALRSLPTFGHRAPVLVWLLAIARRVVATHFDRTAREQRRHQRAAAQPPEPPGGDPAEALALGELLSVLDSPRRDAFVLTQILGLSYGDAATVCGCPVGTIRSRVARARDQLITAHTSDGAEGVELQARRQRP